MANIDAIKSNVAKMLAQNAPESDVEAYLKSEGVTAADLRAGPAFDAFDTAADVGKSAGIGVAKGVIGGLGMGGDVRSIAAAGVDFLGGKMGVAPDKVQAIKDTGYSIARHTPMASAFTGPTSSEIQKRVEEHTGEFYKPQTRAGRYAETAGEFAPNLLMPGTAAQRVIAGVAAPALASQTAGEVTAGSAAEPFARVGGAIAGGLTGSGALALINSLKAKVPGMSAGAGRVLEKAVTPGAEQRLAELGDKAFVLESTPSTLGVAQGIATRPGEGQSRLVDAMTVRQRGANARLASELDNTLGPAVAPSGIEASLVDRAADCSRSIRRSRASMCRSIYGTSTASSDP